MKKSNFPLISEFVKIYIEKGFKMDKLSWYCEDKKTWTNKYMCNISKRYTWFDYGVRERGVTYPFLDHYDPSNMFMHHVDIWYELWLKNGVNKKIDKIIDSEYHKLRIEPFDIDNALNISTNDIYSSNCKIIEFDLSHGSHEPVPQVCASIDKLLSKYPNCDTLEFSGNYPYF